jgi:hypothetical protein
MEHSVDLRNSLEKLYDQYQQEWDKALKKLEEKENEKLEDLALKVQDKKSTEEIELQKKMEAENATTESRVLSEELKVKIKASRDRQVQGKLRYDTEQSYREGAHLIGQGAEMEKEILRGNHYNKVLTSQFDILMNANYKYKAKLDRLMMIYFQRATRNV